MLQTFLGWQGASKTEHPSIGTQLAIRVLTHNIRYATSSLFDNEKPWKDRYPLIMNELLYHTYLLDGSNNGAGGASFICMQEVLHGQLHDILTALNGEKASQIPMMRGLPHGPNWAHIGVAREDGKRKGEYSPILYPTRLFNLLHFENTWLSPTPNKPSKGWDAGSERILTSGVFEHKTTGQRVAAFNTHLDNAGSKAREESVAIILHVIDRICEDWSIKRTTNDSAPATNLDFFLAGDFNSFPTQEAYKAVVASDKMVDTHDAVARAARYGDEVTFTGFRPDTDDDRDEIGRIDFVWVGPKSRVKEQQLVQQQAQPSLRENKAGWKVRGYSVLPNVFDDGVYCSDHRCVVADVVLRQD